MTAPHPGRGPAIDVGVIIVTYNSSTHVDGLLASLAAGLGGLRARVVVVDNGSTDDTVARLRSHPGAEVLVQQANRGYASAINAGLERTCDAPAVLVLNPDLTLGAGSVPALLAAAREPGAGIVVPQIRAPDGDIYPSLRREPSLGRALGAAVIGGRLAGRYPRLSETIMDDASYRARCDVDWATGAAMLVTRECLDATGTWDESYFLYSEETDFADRARRAGFRVVYEPAAVVCHTGGDGMTSPRLRSMLVVNRLRYFRRRHGRLASAAFFVAVLGNELSRGVLGNRAALAASLGLLRPGLRPPELACSDRLMPR
ncbi:MAG TPA: glycosyltransferase family 2 protein [Acidimicrobiales bacterium]